jgi:DNA-binding response OmpR family regulator
MSLFPPAPKPAFPGDRLELPTVPEFLLPALQDGRHVRPGEERRPRVLVVDDDQEMRLFLEESLRDEGYEACCASDVVGALMHLLARPTDLAIIDWKMPQLDGFELLGSVRRCLPRLPVLFVTGYARPEIRDRALQAGACGFLAKPFAIDELLDQVRRGIEDGAALETTSTRDTTPETDAMEDDA